MDDHHLDEAAICFAQALDARRRQVAVDQRKRRAQRLAETAQERASEGNCRISW
jgi:hypothetical protein